MLYLHGAGGRGNDGQRHLNDGPAPLLTEGIIDWPILVVFPQCEDVDSPIFECWRANSPDAQRALRILAEDGAIRGSAAGGSLLLRWIAHSSEVDALLANEIFVDERSCPRDRRDQCVRNGDR